MLRKLSDEVRYAEQRAAHAAEIAAKTGDPRLKADYLAMARSWSKLARSYEVAERLGDFIHHNKARKAAALRTQIPIVHCPDCAAPMRVMLVVPHEKYANLDDRTYECTCGRMVELAIAKVVEGGS